jgi:hypothetical protein
MQEHEEESVKIAARWLKSNDLDSLRRQWKYISFQLHQEIPYPTEAGFKLALGGMAQTDPKAAALRMDEVADSSIINELVKQGFFKRGKPAR